MPGEPLTYLLESFLLAAFVPVLVSLLLMWVLPKRSQYDFGKMKTLIRGLDHVPQGVDG